MFRCEVIFVAVAKTIFFAVIFFLSSPFLDTPILGYRPTTYTIRYENLKEIFLFRDVVLVYFCLNVPLNVCQICIEIENQGLNELKNETKKKMASCTTLFNFPLFF